MEGFNNPIGQPPDAGGYHDDSAVAIPLNVVEEAVELMAAANSTAGLKVLLLDGSSTVAAQTEQSLLEAFPEGVVLTHAADLAAAELHFARVSFDLALVSLTSTGSRGIHTIAQVRERVPHIPIVAITDNDDISFGLGAIRAGAQDCLAGSRIDCTQLARSLRYAIERHWIHDGIEQRSNWLERASGLMSEIFMEMPVPCYTYDSAGVILEWNRACEAMYGQTAAEVAGRRILDTIVPPEDEEAVGEMVRTVFAGQSWAGLECTHLRCDGVHIEVQYSTFPLRNDDGVIFAGIAANVDITERNLAQAKIEAQMEQIEAQLREINEQSAQLRAQTAELQEANTKLQTLATTDGLTGLNNHRAFQDFLELEIQKASRYGLLLALILIDVDNFKQYNDTYGHPAGDEVLRTVARILKETARDTDVVARYGGEEFVVVLPFTSEASAIAAAERFRAEIESAPWPKRAVTASFGVACVTPETSDRSQLIAEADAALYASKRNGRNRVSQFSSLAAEPHARATAA
jgi:diguanylate cyclase (GGDEF)-like protein/PAS domain S-box-containing protein